MGIRTEMHQVIGLMLANALAAASGALVAQSQGFMDVSIQGGVIVVGLAALTIGMSVMRSDRIAAGVPVGGCRRRVIYRCIVALSLRMGIPPNAVKLITAILVFAFVAARIHGKGIFTVTSLSAGRLAGASICSSWRMIVLHHSSDSSAAECTPSLSAVRLRGATKRFAGLGKKEVLTALDSIDLDVEGKQLRGRSLVQWRRQIHATFNPHGHAVAR